VSGDHCKAEAGEGRTAASAVVSTIRYLGPCEGKPVFYGRRSYLDNLPLEDRDVCIEDVRPRSSVISLCREGFALLPHRSAAKDFFDPAVVRDTYLCETEEFLRQLTKATKVMATTYVIRRSERSPGFCKDHTTVPGRFVHCDFSANPAGSCFWVRKVLPEDEARARLRQRFAIYNVWRVLSDPPQDTPLAICDASSIAPDDRVSTDCVAELSQDPNLDAELTLFRYSPHHRWCYFSNMTRDEVLVFNGFDSDSHRVSGVPHVAFSDPSCPAEAPPRESIDARFIAFFDE
jgi:hypothetical protein